MVSAEQYGVPKLKAVLFDDDCFGTIMSEEAPYKNKDGLLIQKYLIVPKEHLMMQYPELQRKGALPIQTSKGPALWREYPIDLIDDTNPSRTNAIVRIHCGFDGRPAAHSDRYKKLTAELIKLRMEMESLTISNLQLIDDNKRLQGEVISYIKHIAEVKNLMKGETHGTGETTDQRPAQV